MINLFQNAPFWAFLFCLFGAIFSWYAADRFRDQILADSHRLVREVALRYLQIMVGVFSVFLIGMLLSVGNLVSKMINLNGVGTSNDQIMSPVEKELLPLNLEMTSTASSIIVTNTPLDQPTTIVEIDPETATPIPKKGIIQNTNGVGANMRSTPGLDGAVIQVVPDGTEVTLLGGEESRDTYLWLNVALPGGQQGWIASVFLSN